MNRNHVIVAVVSGAILMGPIAAILVALDLLSVRPALVVCTSYCGMISFLGWLSVLSDIVRKERISDLINALAATTIFLMFLLFAIFNWHDF